MKVTLLKEISDKPIMQFDFGLFLKLAWKRRCHGSSYFEEAMCKKCLAKGAVIKQKTFASLAFPFKDYVDDVKDYNFHILGETFTSPTSRIKLGLM
ncbi:hypothetical protein RIF29_38451 [Crotalaria pallida]|uniref:Uncharacterized protein n=1 Tax=Crotalaria pallida TaxID=3830 RepID=A0AAN9HLJ3_CROPI